MVEKALKILNTQKRFDFSNWKGLDFEAKVTTTKKTSHFQPQLLNSILAGQPPSHISEYKINLP